jgi:hypothetical protein
MFVLEAVPLVAGAGIGWGLHRFGPTDRARSGLLLATSVAVGAGVSALAGELSESVVYVAWDATQVAVGGLAALALLARRRHRRFAR